jgi:heme/copper-type cytochrome/quinol oxidase subunit 2
MGDMGSQNMMNYTSYDGFLTGLLSLLIKILFVILIISIILGVSLWIKNNYLKNVNITQYVNQNPITKSAVGIIAAIFILFLLLYFFSYLTGSNYGMGGYGIVFNFAGIIVFLFKALTFIFVITLIVSLIVYMIKQLGITDLHLFQFTSKTTQDNTTTTTNNSYINVPTPAPAEEQDNDTI